MSAFFRTTKKTAPPLALTGDLEELKLFLVDSRDRLSMLDRLLLEKPLPCKELLRRFHTIKADASFVQLSDLRRVAQESETLLTFLIRGELLPNAVTMRLLEEGIRLTRLLLDSLERALIVDGLLYPVEAVADFIEANRREVANSLAKRSVSEPVGAAKRTRQITVRIGWGQVDQLTSLVDQLSSLVVDPLPEVKSVIGELKVLSREMRMELAEVFFPSLRRIVRDTSQAVGREVDLDLVGGGVLLPRHFASLLAEWLPHLVRNAIDHGLEGPAERIRLGKEPVGSLAIAFAEGADAWSVEVRDDGRGISGENDQFRRIFEAGFSTKRECDLISGRGMGLDIVANGIKELGGTINVSSTRGEQTTFILSLPKS